MQHQLVKPTTASSSHLLWFKVLIYLLRLRHIFPLTCFIVSFALIYFHRLWCPPSVCLQLLAPSNHFCSPSVLLNLSSSLGNQMWRVFTLFLPQPFVCLPFSAKSKVNAILNIVSAKRPLRPLSVPRKPLLCNLFRLNFSLLLLQLPTVRCEQCVHWWKGHLTTIKPTCFPLSGSIVM